jgi:hypothetical protein
MAKVSIREGNIAGQRSRPLDGVTVASTRTPERPQPKLMTVWTYRIDNGYELLRVLGKGSKPAEIPRRSRSYAQ